MCIRDRSSSETILFILPSENRFFILPIRGIKALESGKLSVISKSKITFSFVATTQTDLYLNFFHSFFVSFFQSNLQVFFSIRLWSNPHQHIKFHQNQIFDLKVLALKVLLFSVHITTMKLDKELFHIHLSLLLYMFPQFVENCVDCIVHHIEHSFVSHNIHNCNLQDHERQLSDHENVSHKQNKNSMEHSGLWCRNLIK